MDLIENLKEPITKLDILYGVCGYLGYKWGIIFWEIGKNIYKNIREVKGGDK
jgi:hypothetical protein